MLHEEMKHTFEFDDGRAKPLRSCGLGGSHTVTSMRLLLNKFGLYMKHMEEMVNDKTFKPAMRAKVQGYLKTWKKTSILVQLALYIDLMAPISQLSLVL